MNKQTRRPLPLLLSISQWMNCYYNFDSQQLYSVYLYKNHFLVRVLLSRFCVIGALAAIPGWYCAAIPGWYCAPIPGWYCTAIPRWYGVEGGDDHEGYLHHEEEADDHYQHHGGAVGIPLLAVPHRGHRGPSAKSNKNWIIKRTTINCQKKKSDIETRHIRTRTFAFDPTVTDSVFMRSFRVFLGCCEL